LVSTFARVQPFCFIVAVRNITLPRPLALHDMTGDKIVVGEIAIPVVVTHLASLEDAPEMYKKLRDKEAGAIKIVMRPGI
jgi:threonine dehydrogenase-like Zn-dependent dehydrogenase